MCTIKSHNRSVTAKFITFVMNYKINLSTLMSKIQLRRQRRSFIWLKHFETPLLVRAARPYFQSCRMEEPAMMELEGTSSQCLHLSHPLTSLNEKWMGALKKLVKRYLTSVFPALFILFMSECVCVHLIERLCVCVSLQRQWALWICTKLEKGRSRSLTGGPAATAALLALQSQGVVTSQGQRFSGVPSERVNDGPLPSGPGLAAAWWRALDWCAAAFSSHGRVKGKALSKI